MNGIRWTEDDLRAYRARGNRATVPAPDVESNLINAAPSTDASQEIHPRFSIHVHSKRRRLADPDGISAKYAIDGLVTGGILQGDGPTHVESVTFSQEQSDIEETIIELVVGLATE